MSYDATGQQIRNLRLVPAAGFEDHAVSVAGTDVVAPAFVRGEVRGEELKLFFDEALDTASAPPGSAFFVRASTRSDREPGREFLGTGTASIQGSVVTVTLAEAVREDETVVHATYTPSKAGPNPLKDAAGNLAAGSGLGPWDVAHVDSWGPRLVPGTVSGTSVTLRFDETLDDSSVPAASVFDVTVDGTDVTPGSIAVAGVEITMALPSAAGASATVKVGFAGTTGIRDSVGNGARLDSEAYTLTNLAAADPGAPALQSVSADGVTLTLTYDKPLDPLSVPVFVQHNGPFELDTYDNGGGALEGVGGIEGAKVLLSIDVGIAPCARAVLPTPEGNPNEDANGHWKNLVLTYRPANAGGKPLQNLWGTDAAAFKDVEVTNAGSVRCVSVQPSGMSGLSGQGKSVTLDFRRSLDTGKTLAPRDFEIEVPGASAPAVSAASFTSAGTGVELALSRALAAGETATASYKLPKSGQGLWDTAGNQIDSFSGVALRGASTTPSLSAADARVPEGGTLEFAVTLDAAATAAVTVDWAIGEAAGHHLKQVLGGLVRGAQALGDAPHLAVGRGRLAGAGVEHHHAHRRSFDQGFEVGPHTLFGAVGARVGDGCGGLRSEQHQHLLVVVGKRQSILLVGEEEIAHVRVAVTHRGALEGLRAHELGGEAKFADVGRQVGDPHRPFLFAPVGEQLLSVGPLGQLALLVAAEAGGDELAHLARLVEGGDRAVVRAGQRPGSVERFLQHGSEVEARAGAQDGRAQRGGALAGRLEFTAQAVDIVHRWSSPPLGSGPGPPRRLGSRAVANSTTAPPA